MNVGGPSLHVLHLTKGLSERGFETRLAVGEPQPIEGSMIGLARDAGINPVLIPGLDRPIHLGRDLVAFWNIVREMRRFQPHIVHTHTAKAGILGRLAAICCGVPVIAHTFHGHVFTGYFSPAASQGIMGFERLLARMTDLIVVLSPGLRDDLMHRLRLPRSGKVRIVPLGLDLPPLTTLPRHSAGWRKQFRLAPGALLLGIVARLVPVKNHLLLLEVFARLAAEDSRLHLAIVGGGESEPEIRHRVTELGLSGRVFLTGIEHDISRVYADLDLLLLVSRNEGTPVVLIEALAAGCPVAATDVGGVREVLDNGRFGAVLPTDAPALKAAVQDVIRQLPDRERRSQDFRVTTAERYGVAALLDSLSGMYKELLRKKGLPLPAGIV